MTLARAFGAFAAAATPPAALTPRIAEAVADGVGCIVAGATSDAAERIRAALGDASGAVAVLGTSDQAPPGLAALRMAAAGHAHDFDDWEEPANTHPTVVLFPALFAAAHLAPVSAETFRTAYAVGFEVIARLGEAVGLSHYARGFHTTGTLAGVGAAAAAARALSLTGAETTHAIGLAASQAQGYTLQFGSSAKALQAGAAARSGIESALLARAGCTAQPGVLCAPRGLAGLLGARDPDQIAAAQAKLGAPWALAEYGVVLKPWPSCGYTHRLMTAALELRAEGGADIASATEIHATLPDFHRAVLPFDRPQSRTEALFSIPSCVALTLLQGGLTLADAVAGFWTRDDVRALAGRVTVTAEPARRPERNYDPEQPDRLSLRIGGRRLEAVCAFPLGAPQNPMSPAQLAAKFGALIDRPARRHAQLMDWDGAPDIARHVTEALA